MKVQKYTSWYFSNCQRPERLLNACFELNLLEGTVVGVMGGSVGVLDTAGTEGISMVVGVLKDLDLGFLG